MARDLLLTIYFLCCRMAKQKRKAPGAPEKKRKTLKKAAAESPGACEGTQGSEEAPEVGPRPATCAGGTVEVLVLAFLWGRKDGADCMCSVTPQAVGTGRNFSHLWVGAPPLSSLSHLGCAPERL